MIYASPYLRYLSIPPGYDSTYRLRWSGSGDAIETPDGKTFIVAAALSPFLEGFAAQRPLIHFAHILDLLRLLGHCDVMLSGLSIRESNRIKAAFRRQGNPLRNAGAFFAVLCANVPSAFLPGYNDRDLAKWCASAPSIPITGWENPEDPPLDAAAFRLLLHDGLPRFSDEEIAHWFRYGRAPVTDEGKQLADEIINAKPPAVRGTFEDHLRQRPRLAGALPLVGTMVSAIAMPPRRRSPPELPLGGYADVTNRGEPERLLPSQFALDDDEFVRRFAEKELLFFRREEPHQRTREQLVLLVDQGVRCWGVVRLALVASVIAFRKLAQRRKLLFVIRFSGNCDPIDPSECDPTVLMDRLEASDLSATPADLLAAANRDDGVDEADCVFLTHSRNLVDDEVKRSAAAISANQRLFALGVDEEGTAQFCQLRQGEPTPISRFRVDFRATEELPICLSTDQGLWTGDVELVPFPFPNGPIQKILAAGFDADARFLLVVTQRGYLHLWDLESGKVEILPRALHEEGKPVTEVHAILGVRGGFVVAGQHRYDLIAAHFDIDRRRVRLHRLGLAATGAACWYSFPGLNAIAVRDGEQCRGLDLDSGGRFEQGGNASGQHPRAYAANYKALEHELPLPRIPTRLHEFGRSQAPISELHLLHDRVSGVIRIRSGAKSKTIHPKADGKNLFEGVAILQALFAGGTLAIRSQLSMSDSRWHLIDVEEPSNIIELVVGPKNDPISTLSSDGSCFAHSLQSGRVAVHRCVEGGPQVLVTAAGKHHNNLAIRLGKTAMHIVIGHKRHCLMWSNGCLAHQYERLQKQTQIDEGWWVANQRGQQHPLAAYDPDRFVSIASNAIDVLIDATGQIIVFDPQRKRIVCIFKVRRRNLAAWMPDGTRYGPADMIGGPATPDALQRIGAALRQASTPMEG